MSFKNKVTVSFSNLFSEYGMTGFHCVHFRCILVLSTEVYMVHYKLVTLRRSLYLYKSHFTIDIINITSVWLWFAILQLNLHSSKTLFIGNLSIVTVIFFKNFIND